MIKQLLWEQLYAELETAERVERELREYWESMGQRWLETEPEEALDYFSDLMEDYENTN
jgi:hypothetical protein